jgi:membrane-associated phospholipid phosphatase
MLRRHLPQGPLDAVRQLLLFGGAYYVYRIVRGVVDGEVTSAFSHARWIVNLERGLHLFFEPSVQTWTVGRAWLIHSSDFLYVNAHVVITTAFLVWLYFSRNEAFYFVRNMFMVAMGLALLLYVVFPTAPPRFLPEWGFTDTVTDFFGQGASHSASMLYNPYAAMPSMHVAIALMVGVSATRLVRWRGLKLLWAIYPVLITFVVIVTANHFWLDAAGGALVAALSAYASAALARARPDAWAWAGATA